METLASILSGAPTNPYQGAGGGIAPLLQQALLARQLGAPQLGQSAGQGAMPGGTDPLLSGQAAPGVIPGAPNAQIGSLAQLALPGIVSGTY